jgi:hypothetical protein
MKKAAIIIVVVVVVAAGISTALILRDWPHPDVETKDYAYTDFTTVEIGSPSEFEIRQSSSYSVSVGIEAGGNLKDYIRVSKSGQTLTIKLDAILFMRSIPLRISVTMPDIHGLIVSIASQGTISGFSSAEGLSVTVAGASRVTGDVTAGNMQFDISGASTIQLKGSAGDIVAIVSGASHLNLDHFRVGNCDINISGASTGTINLTGRLDADVSGASTLLYIGEPAMGDVSVTGPSTLRRK